jgi:hypothetical protein
VTELADKWRTENHGDMGHAPVTSDIVTGTHRRIERDQFTARVIECRLVLAQCLSRSYVQTWSDRKREK